MTSSVSFAVLLCTHNGEEFLEEQLASIAAQSLSPSRVEIHDWGSDDGTRSIAADWTVRAGVGFPIELYCHPEAPGACLSFLQSLVMLVQRSDASHVLLCDQDDVWAAGKLARYRDFVEKAAASDPLDLIFSDVELIDQHGLLLSTSFYGRFFSPFRRVVSIDCDDVAWVNPAVGMSMCLSRRLADLLVKHRNAPWLMHDWAAVLLCRIFRLNSLFVAETLAQYRQHAKNQRGSPALRRLPGALARLRVKRQRIEQLLLWSKTLPSTQKKRSERLFATERLTIANSLLRSRNLRFWYRLVLAFSVLLLAE